MIETFSKLDAAQRQLYCEEGSSRRNLPAASIEKDFWVCWILHRLFTIEGIGDNICFKGGTSLSKCFGIIARFSEDVDVTIHRHFFGFHDETPSSNSLKRLREACSAYVRGELLDLLSESISSSLTSKEMWTLSPASESDDPTGQSLVFEYPGVLTNRIQYLRPAVKIEMGTRNDYDPVEYPVISPYLCQDFKVDLGPGEFAIKTASPLRTFWEKAMLLHEERFRPDGNSKRKAALARHYYDLWAIGQNGYAEKALCDKDLFDRISQHRMVFYRISWMDYSTVVPGQFKFTPSEGSEDSWKSDYDAMREEMFYGVTPSFDEIMETMRQYETRFSAGV